MSFFLVNGMKKVKDYFDKRKSKGFVHIMHREARSECDGRKVIPKDGEEDPHREEVRKPGRHGTSNHKGQAGRTK